MKTMGSRVKKIGNFEKLIKSSQNCEGSILAITMLALVIISFLAGSLSNFTILNASNFNYQENAHKARFLAEAGANEAISVLQDDFNAKNDDSNFPLTTLGEGTYDVTVVETAGQVLIKSVGTVRNISREVLISVADDTASTPFDYAFFSNGDTIIEGDPVVTGGIHSNEDMYVIGDPTISGNISATGSVDITGSPTYGDAYSGVVQVAFPFFDFNYYYNLADPADRYAGDLNLSGNQTLTPANGVIFVDGNVRIAGTLNITGAIVATGSITVNGNVNQTGVSGMPILMSRDSYIRINGNVLNGDGLIYSGSNDVQIYGNVSMTGQIVSYGELVVTGSPTVVQGSDETFGMIEGTSKGFRKIYYHE